MPAEKNTTLRIIVPIIVAVLGVVIVVAGYRNSARQAQRPQPTTPAPAPTLAPAEDQPPNPTPAQAEPPPPPVAAPTLPPQPHTSSITTPAVPRLRARPQPPSTAPPASIGALVHGGQDKARIDFTRLGAGVEAITMADYFDTIAQTRHYEVQRRQTVPGPTGRPEVLTSLAARAVLIDGQLVDLFGSDSEPLWRETAPGCFEAEVIDENDNPVLRITRAFSLRPASFLIDAEQRLENLTTETLRVEWVQYGPIELNEDGGGYGLDMRRVRLGYLLDPARDPSRQIVHPDTRLQGRAAVISRTTGGSADGLVWPRPADFANAAELVWVAQTSRYFAFAVMPRLDPAAAASNFTNPAANPLDKRLALADEVYAIVRGQPGQSDPKLLLQLTSAPTVIAPGNAADLSFSAYAGPLARTHLAPKVDPLFGALALSDLVIYNIGGMCAWCTFQPLARGLLAFLTFAHDYLVFDWALAIMLLVVCVRALLHPITRRSQIAIARFSKQMQALAPKQQKIREKFKDDPKRMQQEMVQLMREEKVSYRGALGCLPMFLQMPIWIALYAMLYFSFELRHQPAFYGVFQFLTGGRWLFLADLSVADHFIPFGVSFTVPLLGFRIDGLNILPLLLGIVFYIQQKYLTPTPTQAMTPEQEMQFKMMRFMTVVMFPVFMYPAPAGLSVYFITNSVLGILESRWIRAHITELEKNPPPPRDSFLKRVENLARQRKQK